MRGRNSHGLKSREGNLHVHLIVKERFEDLTPVIGTLYNFDIVREISKPDESGFCFTVFVGALALLSLRLIHGL
jgi:hypothetical protein